MAVALQQQPCQLAFNAQCLCRLLTLCCAASCCVAFSHRLLQVMKVHT